MLQENHHSPNLLRRSLYVAAFLILFGGIDCIAERLAVTATTANVRSGPGLNHDVLWRVEKYHPVSIIRKSGSWYYFSDFEGDTGWIHASLVGNISSVITSASEANVRAGPGTQYQILSAIGKGVPFKVIDRKGNWIYVQHGDGDKGWLHKSLLW